MIKRMKFLHLRIRTFMVSAFGTIVVIGFRTSFLVKETKIMAMTMHTNLEWKIPVLPKHRYDWSKSTEENYKAETSFCGKYGNVREHLDHTYHSTYTKSRQLLQDSIIDTLLHNTRIVDKAGMSCATPTQPWIVFTAGAMGAGKSWTIRNLAERGYFPVHSFVTVDPDDIRRHLPEFDLYVAKSPQQAGDLTRKEAGYIAETLTEIALQRGHNVLVDGTLKDHRWYSHFFATLREQRPNIKIAILHITAPRHAIMERAKQRAHMTGRVVPRDTIELAMREVPKSVEILAPRTDFYAEIYNAPETPNVEMRTEHISWEDFTNVWTQTCSSSTKKKIDDCLGSTRECEAPTLRSVL